MRDYCLSAVLHSSGGCPTESARVKANHIIRSYREGPLSRCDRIWKDPQKLLDKLFHRHKLNGMRQWTPTEVRELRKTYGLTLKALGELVGVTYLSIYRWEGGLRAPSKTTKLLLERVEQDLRKGKEVKKR